MPFMAGMDMAMPYWAMSRGQGGGKMLEGTKGQGKIKWKSKFGQSTIWNSGLCFIWFLPTKCSMKWPQETKIWILAKYFMGVNQLMFGTQWWWWCAKWCRFVKIQIWPNLESDLMLSLCLLILSNRKRTSQSGQQQSCSTWWGLGLGAKSWETLV